MSLPSSRFRSETLCTKVLRRGRENNYPSRYPPFLGPIPPIYNMTGGLLLENGRETGGKTKNPPVR